MKNRVGAFALGLVTSSLFSMSVAFACYNCDAWPEPRFSPPQEQQINALVNQLSEPGKQAQIREIAVGFIQAHTAAGQSVEEAIQHLTNVAQ